MKNIIDKFTVGLKMPMRAINALRKMSLKKKILLALGVLGGFGLVGFKVTGKPGFCNTCHIMNPYYSSWKASAHNEVNCMDCHSEPGFVGYAKGKSVAPAHLINYVLGREPTKPNATVRDASCLRPECHNTEKLASENVSFNGVKFTHKTHVAKVVDGITISCTTCHSHIRDGGHFEVNRDVCFTCHFLKIPESDARLVQTACRDCHEVPDKIIQRGPAAINHAEFLPYVKNCDEACHRGQTETLSEIDRGICLNCHDYDKTHEPDKTVLHEIHSNCEKVECIACHGDVSHFPTKTPSDTTVAGCNDCHTDTHNIQTSLYTARKHPGSGEDERIINPMFLTHVGCSGCHTEHSRPATGDDNTIATVAKAVPDACDRCHKPGTGQLYIPFWQGNIKKLYEQVAEKVSQLEKTARSQTNKDTREQLESRIADAKAILKTVEADGSWGIHNLKYTEALLLKANTIIREAQ